MARLIEWPEIEAVCGKNKRHELVIKGPLNRNDDLDSEELQKMAFYEGVSVNFISLTNCNLRILHSQISNCMQLIRLTLANNLLTDLPEEIGNLPLLKVLDVSGNKLTGLPRSFKDLTKLESLIATHNELQIDGLFDFSEMEQLRVLDLSYNQLTSTPNGISSGKLVHLHTVNFSNNSISQIDESFSILSQLKDLNLSSNDLEAIPGPLGRLDKMKMLNISNNKFKDSRFAKLSNDKRTKVSAILTYIKKNATNSKELTQSNSKEQLEVVEKEEKSIPIFVGKESYTVERLPEVKDIRPFLVCCVVQGLDISGENFKKFINIQTKLHASLCGNRTIAAIGTHDLATFSPPLKYLALPPEELHITALHKKTPVNAKELIEVLLRDAELARKRTKRSTVNPLHRYLHLVENLPLLPCLIDSNGLIISFAPVTNSDKTKLSEATNSVWIEVSSSESLQVCKDVMDQIIAETLQFSPNLEIYQVRISTSEDLISAYPDKSDLSSIKTERKTV